VFGHAEGACRGAGRAKVGRFAAAREDTVLLDEADALGPERQAKPLRVIEYR
jgi:transcriptional regulator with GAF, ATPase, and Fis domain